jgi:nephrocystin-3
MPKNNQEFRVFISSTFSDMHDERDLLNKEVFPDIRKICWERGINFSPVDLRWGINSEESERGDILRICLDEVASSRPFFIGLLGQRYGWIPEKEQSSLDNEDYSEVVSTALLNKRSVTEMEITYGVLNKVNNQALDAYFYFNNEGKPLEEESHESQSKLIELKDRIRSWAVTTDNADKIFDGYQSLETLSSRIHSDLLKVIDSRWPVNEVPNLTEREVARHYSFANSRREGYISDVGAIKRLDNFIYQKDERQIIITGPSGIGKSALLADFAYRAKHHFHDMFIFEYYVDAATISSERSLMELLLDKMNVPDKRGNRPLDITQYLKEEIIRLDKVLVLILDVGDEISLNFFNELPDNVLLITTRKKSYEEDIKAIPILEAQPLNESQKRQVITYFSTRYRKYFEEKHIDIIIAAHQTSHPLFLRTLLDEIRIFSRIEGKSIENIVDEVTGAINYHLNCKDISDLFELVIINREEYLGRTLVKEVLTLIACSLHGLTENELLNILSARGLSCSQRELVVVLRLLGTNVSLKGGESGAYYFSNSAIIDAIKNRYKINVIKEADRINEVNKGYLDHLVHSNQAELLDERILAQHINHKKADASFNENMYSINASFYAELVHIPNFLQSKFYAYVYDGLIDAIARFDVDNKRATLFEVNKLLYFTNKIDPVQGANILESISALIKDRRIDKWANYVEGTMDETSTLFYCYTTIYMLRDYKRL